MVIYDQEIEVKIGACIRPDNWAFGSRLIPSVWNKADFRLPRPNAFPGDPIQSLAVNVVIMGRSFQRRQGDHWCRVRIEFVGDGEPSVFAGGWMLREWA